MTLWVYIEYHGPGICLNSEVWARTTFRISPRSTYAQKRLRASFAGVRDLRSAARLSVAIVIVGRGLEVMGKAVAGGV